MRWINVLHFYQPPLSSNDFVLEAAKLSYSRLARALLSHPEAKITLNFSGCLLEQLLNLDQEKLIADWQKLVARGQVELLGSAYWHALLPKIRTEEVACQVAAQEKMLARVFKIKHPSGFFAPELAYSPELLVWLASRGYSYAVVDEIHIGGTLNQPKQLFYQDEGSGMMVAVRQREWSKKYPPEALATKANCPETLLTATDGELYGLRHLDIRGNLEKCLADHSIKKLTVSEAMAISPHPIANIVSASWESWPSELKAKEPYAIWDDRSNKIQQRLWSLANLAQRAAIHFKGDANQEWVSRHLHWGLASCAWWWASNRDFVLFGGRAWNPEEIIRGAEQLTKSVRSIMDPRSQPWKLEADKMFCGLQAKIWREHWRRWPESK